MKKFWILALGLLVAVNLPLVSAAADAIATRGQMLYDSNGARVANVSRVNNDGSVSIIIDGKVITVPANTLSVEDGKLKTNMTRNQLLVLG